MTSSATSYPHQRATRSLRHSQEQDPDSSGSAPPPRCPRVVFYIPKELGGPSRLPIGRVFIPQSALPWSKLSNVAATHRQSNPIHEEELSTLGHRRELNEEEGATTQNRRSTLEDPKDSRDHGIPRINSAFQRGRHTLVYDRCWRVRPD